MTKSDSSYTAKILMKIKLTTLWLKGAASRMDNKECSDDPLFVTLVEALHNLDPSADSAYYLGLLNDKRGNELGGLKIYEESIKLGTDPYKKAKILYKSLKFKNAGRKSSARNYANKNILSAIIRKHTY